MNTNDAIVLHTIQQDMKHKGVENYELQDVVVSNPTLIEVSPNEAVYVVYFSTVFTRWTFNVNLVSATDNVQYSEKNTRGHLSYTGDDKMMPPDFKQLIETGMTNFESPQISKHFGSIKVKKNPQGNEFSFLLRYIRVKF